MIAKFGVSHLVIDGSINGELFTLYAENVLAPSSTKGDIVVLDNPGSHEGRAARRAICGAGVHLSAPVGRSSRPGRTTLKRTC